MTPKFKIGQKVYDKTSRRVCVVEHLEPYKHSGEIWFVVRYVGKNSIFVRNCHAWELKEHS